MPLKKSTFTEIKKGVILEIEGAGPLEIAKALTAEYLKELHERHRFPTERLLILLQINKDRSQYDSIRDIAAAMREQLQPGSQAHQEIKDTIVHPKRVRDMKRSDLWKEFAQEVRAEHIRLLAREEARKLLEKQKNE